MLLRHGVRQQVFGSMLMVFLISSVPSATAYSASGMPNYVILGSMRSGGLCFAGRMSPLVAFNGAIDDFSYL